MDEKLKEKIHRRQKTIVSDDEPLYRHGYWRAGYTREGRQRWVLREYQYIRNDRCYGKNKNNIRSKLINETWEEYHNYLQGLIPKYNKISDTDKERMKKYNLCRENMALKYEHY